MKVTIHGKETITYQKTLDLTKEELGEILAACNRNGIAETLRDFIDPIFHTVDGDLDDDDWELRDENGEDLIEE